MKYTRLLAVSLLSTAALTAAPAREIVDLQRDVAALQEQVRTLQRTLDERMASLATLVQQNLDTSGKSNTSLAVLENSLRDRLAEQQKTLVAPVAGMAAKMDQMASEFSAVRESVADLSERMNKVQLQLVDLNNTVKVLQAPAAPPPPVTGGNGADAGTGTATPPPGLSAQQLYDSARRDASGGNVDLALQGFQEYLKYFGTTELAPSAQFNIGQIYYDKADYTNAIQAFDTVLERYRDNPKTPDAMYMKGMALLKSNRQNEAGREFLTVIQKHPTAPAATKARAQRKALGLNVPAPAKRGR